MSKLSSFLKKFAPEYRELAETVVTVALGIGLDPRERERVLELAEKVKAAADNIEASISSVDAADTKAIKDAVTKVVEETIKKTLPKLVAEEVKKLSATK